MILNFDGDSPKIHESVFIADGAVVIGKVSIGKNSSVWFNSVIRGDVGRIIIGENTNIQDGSIIHCSTDIDTYIGNNITIGHKVILHSCHIEDGSLIGMGSVILDKVKIGTNCLIGAGSLITQNKIIPDNSLVYGNPAKIIRILSEDEVKEFQKGNSHYLELVKKYKPIS